MKVIIQKCTSKIKSLWADESAQGATEYILLLVVVVSLALIFRKRIQSAVTAAVGDTGTAIEGFKVDGN